MNMNTRNSDESACFFSIEDVMSYSNIQLIHVNDNKVPSSVMVKRAIVFMIIAALLAGLFFL